MALFDFLKKKKEDDMNLGDLGGDFPDFGMQPQPSTGMPGTPGTGMQRGVPGVPGTGRYPSPTPPPLMQGPEFGPTATSMQFGPQPMQQQQPMGQDISMVNQIIRNNMDVLNSKIDSLRASIDRLSEKLDFMERYLTGRR